MYSLNFPRLQNVAREERHDEQNDDDCEPP